MNRSEALSTGFDRSEAVAAPGAVLSASLVAGSAIAAGVALLVLLRGLLVLLGRLLIRLLIWLAAIVSSSILRALLVLHQEVDQGRRPAQYYQDDHDHPAASEFL